MSSTKSSLEAASEAAARVNAMLMAKGKLKLPVGLYNKPKQVAGALKSAGDLYTAEVEINDAPLSARNLLTRGLTQDEISKFSGAAVSTRGRFISCGELEHNNSERSLYLHVQASNKDAVDCKYRFLISRNNTTFTVAVHRIQEIIQQHGRHPSSGGGTGGSGTKWGRPVNNSASGAQQNSGPPPLMSLNTSPYMAGLAYVQDKVFVGLEHVPMEFQLKEKLFGPGGSYLQHIRTETGAAVTLRGKGSGYLEPTSGREAFEPLHIHLTHPKPEGLHAARELTINLIQTTQQEYIQWQQQQLALLTAHTQQHAINSQQSAISGIPTVSIVGLGNASSLGKVEIPYSGFQPNTSTFQTGGLTVQAGSSTMAANLLTTSVVPSLTAAVIATQPGLNGLQSQLAHHQNAGLTIPQQPVTVGYITSQAHPSLDSYTNTSTISQAGTQGLIFSQPTAAVATTGVPTSGVVAQLTHPVLSTQTATLPLTSILPHHAQVQQQQAQTATLITATSIPPQVQAHIQGQNMSQAHTVSYQQPSLAAYPFQFAQMNAVIVTTTVTSPTTTTYSVYTRSHADALQAQKRRFTEDPLAADDPKTSTANFQRASNIPNILQQDVNSVLNSFYNHQQLLQVQQAQSLQQACNQTGLQDEVAANFSMPLTSTSNSARVERKEMDKHLMPPPSAPPTHVMQGSKMWTCESDRKRLRGALGNIVVYGSSDEEDDDYGNLQASNQPGRHCQRSSSPYHRNYNPYSSKNSNYPQSHIDDRANSFSHFDSQQQSRSQVGRQARQQPASYSGGVPFWMAPN